MGVERMSAHSTENRTAVSHAEQHSTVVHEVRCLVQSHHPLVVRLIKDALTADPSLKFTIRSYSEHCKPAENGSLQLLILDTCSIQNWASCLEKWTAAGGSSIALISSETLDNNLALKLLHLGASAIVRSADSLADELTRAIHAVANGRLWIRRDVLDLYVKRMRTVLHNISLPEQKLTSRERQILNVLRAGLANDAIAQRFGVSQRTIKFHVSNILRKLKQKNRKDLKSLDYSGNVLLFEGLNPSAEVHLAHGYEPHRFHKTG
jgi:DNA-binding NarL/FixJ family response regulator